jgi:o-succinylbenzoate---CoA ligase
MDFLRPVGGPTRAVVGALADWLAAADEPAPLVVETSGSTGRPKRVVLSRRAVLASVRATERRLGGSGRWLLTLPASYVAGLQVVCRSLVAGHEPVLLEEHASFAAAVRSGQPAFVSLVPTQLHRMLDDSQDVTALRTIRTVLLGGGPIDAALRARAAEAGLHVVATYGSSETAGGCVYDGHPLDGVALAIGPDGRIRIGGPTLFDGYDGDPALTAASLVDGWFLTSDAGRLDEDGRLHVLGRIDDVVISGGVNVPTPAVAARLREHPDVRAAEVLGIPDEEWGHRVVAFIVLSAGSGGSTGDWSLEAARDWVSAAHPRSWAPREVVTLDALPLLANGKPDRLALRELM